MKSTTAEVQWWRQFTFTTVCWWVDCCWNRLKTFPSHHNPRRARAQNRIARVCVCLLSLGLAAVGWCSWHVFLSIPVSVLLPGDSYRHRVKCCRSRPVSFVFLYFVFSPLIIEIARCHRFGVEFTIIYRTKNYRVARNKIGLHGLFASRTLPLPCSFLRQQYASECRSVVNATALIPKVEPPEAMTGRFPLAP